MQAMEIVSTRDRRTPDSETTQSIIRYCCEHGVVLVTAGTYGNVIRLLVPLVISDADLQEALDVLESALSEVTHYANIPTKEEPSVTVA
jgi:4-aminobutyrate aminotransferase/(S)-3-amino-2-methylpropionate transaminase